MRFVVSAVDTGRGNVIGARLPLEPDTAAVLAPRPAHKREHESSRECHRSVGGFRRLTAYLTGANPSRYLPVRSSYRGGCSLVLHRFPSRYCARHRHTRAWFRLRPCIAFL